MLYRFHLLDWMVEFADEMACFELSSLETFANVDDGDDDDVDCGVERVECLEIFWVFVSLFSLSTFAARPVLHREAVDLSQKLFHHVLYLQLKISTQTLNLKNYKSYINTAEMCLSRSCSVHNGFSYDSLSNRNFV